MSFSTNGGRTHSIRIPRAAGRLLVVVLLVAAFATAAEAVTVSPSALYLDQRTRSATLTLFNPGSLPEEIEISFAYGYPTSDAAGNVQVDLVHPDSVAADEPSAAGWLRAFPQRLVLQPGQRQVVRVLVQPPADLENGEYWARVLIRSRGGQPPIEQRDGDVTMRLAVETVIVNSVTFRQGALETGVQVNAATARQQDDGLSVTLDLSRQGTAAYIGRVRLQVVSPGGEVLAETEQNLAVYHDLRRVFAFPRDLRAPPGAEIRYTIETVRPDLPSGGILRADAVSGTLPVR